MIQQINNIFYFRLICSKCLSEINWSLLLVFFFLLPFIHLEGENKKGDDSSTQVIRIDTLDYIDSIFIKQRARNYFNYGLATTSLGYGYIFYSDPSFIDESTNKRSNFSWGLAIGIPILNYSIQSLIFKNKSFLPAEVNMLNMGALNGIAHGVHINRIFQSFRKDKIAHPRYAYIFTLSSIIESQLSYRIGLNKKMDYATTSAWQTGNLWGNVYGTMIGYGLGEEVGATDIMMGSLGLFGSFGGILISTGLHKKYPKTTAEYRSINSFAAALLTYSSGLFRENIDLNPSINNWSIVVANLAGITGAHLFIKDSGFRPSDGLYVAAATALGGGLGLLRYNTLQRPGRFRRMREVSPRILAGTGMLLGWGAAYFSIKAIRSSPIRVRSRQKSSSINYRFNVNPAGAIGFIESPDLQQDILQINGDLSLIKFHLFF